MATERMFLMCVGCKGSIMLGKRMSVGYYKAPEQEALEAFFDRHQVPPCINETLDNFRLILEDDEDFDVSKIEDRVTDKRCKGVNDGFMMSEAQRCTICKQFWLRVTPEDHVNAHSKRNEEP